MITANVLTGRLLPPLLPQAGDAELHAVFHGDGIGLLSLLPLDGLLKPFGRTAL
jgi:hypothetical protein